jgi:hypothetical protein
MANGVGSQRQPPAGQRGRYVYELHGLRSVEQRQPAVSRDKMRTMKVRPSRQFICILHSTVLPLYFASQADVEYGLT